MIYVVSQVLAIIALCIWAYSYHFPSRSKIIISQIISIIFFIFHFILLDAFTGAFVATVGLVRLIVFYFKTKENFINNPIVPAFFIIITIVVTIMTADSYWSLFAFIGGLFAILATASLNKTKIRLLFLPGHMAWTIYNFSIGSYAGAFAEIALGISAVVSLFRDKK